MHKMSKLAFTTLAVSLFIAAGAFSASAEKITTAGSSTIRPIVDQATKAFKKTHPGVTFAVGGGGSSHGVKSVGNGDVMIGQASRYIKDKEMKKFPDLVAHLIGQDGVAIIINKKNPITKITTKMIQDIYTGKVSNWKEVGGHNAPITLISKEVGRSTLGLFLKYFKLESEEIGHGKAAYMKHKVKGTADWSPTKAKLIGPNREALGVVAMKKNAIAYVSIGTAQDVASKGGRITVPDLDGVAATVANVGNSSYPLRRPLHLVTKGQPAGTVKEFIDFIKGPEGQKIVSGLEFVPVN